MNLLLKASGVVTIKIEDIKQNVYIFGCVGATINIDGKCKSVIIDTCKKTRVTFDEVFSTCETVNSSRIHVECRHKCAAVAIDKTDGNLPNLSSKSYINSNLKLNYMIQQELLCNFPLRVLTPLSWPVRAAR